MSFSVYKYDHPELYLALYPADQSCFCSMMKNQKTISPNAEMINSQRIRDGDIHTNLPFPTKRKTASKEHINNHYNAKKVYKMGSFCQT